MRRIPLTPLVLGLLLVAAGCKDDQLTAPIDSAPTVNLPEGTTGQISFTIDGAQNTFYTFAASDFNETSAYWYDTPTASPRLAALQAYPLHELGPALASRNLSIFFGFDTAPRLPMVLTPAGRKSLFLSYSAGLGETNKRYELRRGEVTVTTLRAVESGASQFLGRFNGTFVRIGPNGSGDVPGDSLVISDGTFDIQNASYRLYVGPLKINRSPLPVRP